ncbi:MAG: hypothetical protein ACI8XM_000420 [Haloarculaceae archaeon]|jgi:hypothetical protein
MRVSIFQRPLIPETDAYYLLSNERRRQALTLLWGHPDGVTLRELSEAIATAETGTDPAPRSVRQSVYNALHQAHLPKLDEFGLVEYDPDRKIVRPRREGRHLSRYMDTVTPAGVTWGEYYRALGIGGLCAVVASLTGLPGFDAVDPLVFAIVTLAIFAVSTIYQLVSGTGTRLARLRRP